MARSVVFVLYCVVISLELGVCSIQCVLLNCCMLASTSIILCVNIVNVGVMCCPHCHANIRQMEQIVTICLTLFVSLLVFFLCFQNVEIISSVLHGSVRHTQR